VGAAVVGHELLVLGQGEEAVELVLGLPVAAGLLLAALTTTATSTAAVLAALF
jgi:hypothetical protein